MFDSPATSEAGISFRLSNRRADSLHPRNVRLSVKNRMRGPAMILARR